VIRFTLLEKFLACNARGDDVSQVGGPRQGGRGGPGLLGEGWMPWPSGEAALARFDRAGVGISY
jgi:hypothetical protein